MVIITLSSLWKIALDQSMTFHKVLTAISNSKIVYTHGHRQKRCLQSNCSFLSSARTTVLFHPLSGRQQNMDHFNRKCVCEHAQKICLFKSSCEFSNYHPSLCSPFIHSVVSNARFIHSVVSNDFISAQQSPWSNCMAAQADLGLSYLICPKTCWYALTNKRQAYISFCICTVWSGFLLSSYKIIDLVNMS